MANLDDVGSGSRRAANRRTPRDGGTRGGRTQVYIGGRHGVTWIDVEDLASRGRRRELVESRRLPLALGRERWGQKATDLGAVLGKKADTISYLAREGIRQRLEDEVFTGRYEALDEAMIGDSR